MDPSSYMKLAITEAKKSRYTAPPNPWVACIIEKNGNIVGKGATIGPTNEQSGMHAETIALKDAGDQAKGSTCYVTLEPCSHYGKTPPCADALIQAGVKKVYIAIQDPDKRVRGAGIKKLRDAGIETIVGLEENAAEELLRPYLHLKLTGRPYVCLKVASSIDGCIAAKDLSSKWITGEGSREKVHALRAESQAIIVGRATAMHDKPSLTVRDFDASFKPPIRVLLDSTGKTLAAGPFFDTSLAPTWIFTSKEAPQNIKDQWIAAGATVTVVNQTETGLNLKEVLEHLGKASIQQVLVEGGGQLLGSFIREDLYQKLYLFIGSKFLGDGIRSFSGLDISSLKMSPQINLAAVTKHDKDVCLEYHHSSPIKEVV